MGRWNSIDPLAEMFVNLSPYAYAENNPIVMIDPTGAASTPYTYDWNTGQYKNEHGDNVGWWEVQSYLESGNHNKLSSSNFEGNEDDQINAKSFKLEHQSGQKFISDAQKLQVKAFIEKHGKGDLNVRVSIGSKGTVTRSHAVYQAYVIELQRVYAEWNKYEGNPEAKKLFSSVILSEIKRAENQLKDWIPGDSRYYATMIKFHEPEPLMTWAGSVSKYAHNILGKNYTPTMSFVAQPSSNNQSGSGSGGIGNGAIVIITPRP